VDSEKLKTVGGRKMVENVVFVPEIQNSSVMTHVRSCSLGPFVHRNYLCINKSMCLLWQQVIKLWRVQGYVEINLECCEDSSLLGCGAIFGSP
jgi:hypothetical protein